ncbi:MAG: response regulator [Pseudobdellovibrionaceae bacterium]
MNQEKIFSQDSTEKPSQLTKKKVLCIDDEIDNLDAVERILRKKYQVLKAISGQKALEILTDHPEIAVIVTDQRMPEMTGVQFLQKSISSHPDTSKILLTGYTDLESVINAVNDGQIQRYLTKPWDPIDLGLAVDQASERYALNCEIKKKNAELTKAFAEIKELDRMKTEFMVLINHELKTPLTNIINFASLLIETSLNEEQKMFTDKIVKSSNKLRKIVEDCLLMIKAGSHQLKPQNQNYTIKNFELFIDAEAQMFLTKKNLHLEFSSNPISWITDPFLLGEIIKRVLNNAAKFSSENSTIRIEHTVSDHADEIHVFNEGSKIDEQKKEKLFQPFFIDENIMNHSLGLGLGLSVSQAVGNSLGIKMGISNTPTGVVTTISKTLETHK